MSNITEELYSEFTETNSSVSQFKNPVEYEVMVIILGYLKVKDLTLLQALSKRFYN